MERLCDEIVQLIFYDLSDPGSLALVNRRFHRFSQDPYVRAHYFLTHYGSTEAMFFALGRGKILTERVLDILRSSGAHISRYLVQVSMHHYFYTASHFIKSSWVRNVPFGVFMHFLKLAEEKYGDIPRAKNEDDGYIFNLFLKESRLPPSLKSVNWETIQEILEKYNFIPFSNRDPLMAQFPLALAIEPRLLPYAVKNGFRMDSKYRNFVFRKMFERTASTNENLSEEIAHNVRVLCRLDRTMFVSRTVAAEICMEVKTNVAGYRALKVLDKSGDLRFELADLVKDLIKTFLKTRSICLATTIETLRLLYTDYPTSDPIARLVILITFFNTTENLHCNPPAMHSKLEALNLTPLTRKDVFDILLNPFVDRSQAVVDYAAWGIGKKKDGKKGMSQKDVDGLVSDLVSRCLEVSCKGRLLGKLKDDFPFVEDLVKQLVDEHTITMDDLPPHDDFEACLQFQAKLSRDHTRYAILNDSDKDTIESNVKSSTERHTQSEEPPAEEEDEGIGGTDGYMNLGGISQETLSTMIRHDEVMPTRSRRRMHYSGPWMNNMDGKLPYPPDTKPVGQWIKHTYGHRSRPAAIFMIHAVVNDSHTILESFLPTSETIRYSHPESRQRVPVTLKHFKMLARLGKAPNERLYSDVKGGCEFYLDEEDYLKNELKVATWGRLVKAEISSGASLPSLNALMKAEGSITNTKRRKRPRRTATSVRSYAVPDSDDEAIGDGDEEENLNKPRLTESNLQKWISHLGDLLKEEQRKFKEKKKKHDALLEPGSKSRLYKSDFFKSLISHLRVLRLEDEKRSALYGYESFHDTYSDEDDEEYHQKSRTKKRRIARNP